MVDRSFQEPVSPKMEKLPSQRARGLHAFRQTDADYDLRGSLEVLSPTNPAESGRPFGALERLSSNNRQDSFLTQMTRLPKIEIHSVNDRASNESDPESPISRLLISDSKSERSHSENFSRPLGQFGGRSFKQKEASNVEDKQPSVWRLLELSFSEWLYALLGSIGAVIFGSFNPLFAYIIASIVASYYRIGDHDIRNEVNKWCLFIACMGIITVVANFLQHFYFGIMGEKMTERVRRMMFSGILLNLSFHRYMPACHICPRSLLWLLSCLKMVLQISLDNALAKLAA